MNQLSVTSPATRAGGGRCPLPRRRLRHLSRALTAVLALTVSFAGYHAIETLAHQPSDGRHVEVAGRSLYLRCTGSSDPGQPTVVLAAASGGVAAGWSWVQDDLDDTHRVCSWDRAGLGYSEGAPTSLAGAASDLHGLLRDEVRPFVMVGHSLGAVVVRQYQAAFPADVSGLVLVDGSHPMQLDRAPELGEQLAAGEAELESLVRAGRVGLVRAYLDLGGSMDFDTLPEAARAELEAHWSDPHHLVGMLREHRLVDEWLHDARAIPDLGALPLVVVSAAKASAHEWPALQRDLVALSSRGEPVTVPGSTHMSLLFDRKDATGTSAAIRDLVGAE